MPTRWGKWRRCGLLRWPNSLRFICRLDKQIETVLQGLHSSYAAMSPGWTDGSTKDYMNDIFTRVDSSIQQKNGKWQVLQQLAGFC